MQLIKCQKKGTVKKVKMQASVAMDFLHPFCQHYAFLKKTYYKGF